MNNKKLDDNGISISSYEYKNIFSKKHSLFNNNEQQDYIEFLRFLFEDLNQENNRNKENLIYR